MLTDGLSVFHSVIFSTQISTNARRTTEAVITSAGTQWAPSNAAARKATNCSLMNEHAKVNHTDSYCVISPAIRLRVPPNSQV